MLTACLHLLGYDIWFYLSHRLLHTRLGWHIHRIHHERPYPVWTDTYHGHWSESLLQSLGFCLPWGLGLWSPWESLAAGVVCQLRGLARHDLRSAWLIGNHHVLHHELGTFNYGEVWIDALCGTLDPCPERRIAGWVRV